MTRQYLTEVEEELAQTKALLQQVLSEGTPQGTHTRYSQSHGPVQSREIPEPINGVHEEVSGISFSSEPADQAQGRQVSSAQETNETIGRQSDMPSFSHFLAPSNKETPRTLLNMRKSRLSQPAEAETGPNRPILPMRRGSYRRHRDSDLHSSNVPGLSLETPPSSGSFEWDERTGKASGDRFVDGMASLTSRSNEGGYLGIYPGYLENSLC